MPSGVEDAGRPCGARRSGREGSGCRSRLRGDGEHEEEHQRAVDGDQREIVFGQDGAVQREDPVGPDEMDAHQQERMVPMMTAMRARTR